MEQRYYLFGIAGGYVQSVYSARSYLGPQTSRQGHTAAGVVALVRASSEGDLLATLNIQYGFR